MNHIRFDRSFKTALPTHSSFICMVEVHQKLQYLVSDKFSTDERAVTTYLCIKRANRTSSYETAAWSFCMGFESGEI